MSSSDPSARSRANSTRVKRRSGDGAPSNAVEAASLSRARLTSVAPVEIEPERVAAVQERLLEWFRVHGRDLPWRRTRDPYRILVSEVMLQQTQVDRVIPYYEAFLERFPTLQALAEAPTAEVIRLWAGLGYNRRAVNLQRTARAIVEQHGDSFPKTVEELRQLPGVGPYTAGAIACFAFEQDVPFFDTNIKRVLHRIFVGPERPRPLATDRELHAIAAQVVPAGKGWAWNQAIMEFGALHCTQRKPACVVCPVQAQCRAFPAILSALQEAPRPERGPKEERFEGSTRWFRGRIIDALRQAPADSGFTLAELGPRVREGFTESDLPWLAELVAGLERDGLATVAEDAPEYNVSDGAISARRVRLPD